MKIKILQKIIKKKTSKTEFAIVTNLNNGDSEIYEKGIKLSKNFENYKDNIEEWIKEETEIDTLVMELTILGAAKILNP